MFSPFPLYECSAVFREGHEAAWGLSLHQHVGHVAMLVKPVGMFFVTENRQQGCNKAAELKLVSAARVFQWRLAFK